MRYLAPLSAGYGDLTLERNRRVLVRDAVLLTRRHLHPWEVRLCVDRITAQASGSVFGVVAALYEEYRRAAGKPRWGCKSTFMIDYVPDVLAEYPTARFVWLVRDPRDVAVSSRRSVFSHCHPFLTARLWQRQQATGLKVMHELGAQQVHLLHYEDLVAHPRASVGALCDFLRIPLEENMFRHHESTAARALAAQSESWQQTGRPIEAGRVGLYRRELTPHDQRLVESVAGDTMRTLGYRPDAPAGPARVPRPTRLRWDEARLRTRVEARSLLHDRNFARRLRRDATVRALRIKTWRSARSSGVGVDPEIRSKTAVNPWRG
jgi:hypothetical protein